MKAVPWIVTTQNWFWKIFKRALLIYATFELVANVATSRKYRVFLRSIIECDIDEEELLFDSNGFLGRPALHRLKGSKEPVYAQIGLLVKVVVFFQIALPNRAMNYRCGFARIPDKANRCRLQAIVNTSLTTARRECRMVQIVCWASKSLPTTELATSACRKRLGGTGGTSTDETTVYSDLDRMLTPEYVRRAMLELR